MVLNWLECFFFKYKDLINNLRFLYNAFLPMLFASLRYILLLLTLMRFCHTACYPYLGCGTGILWKRNVFEISIFVITWRMFTFVSRRRNQCVSFIGLVQSLGWKMILKNSWNQNIISDLKNIFVKSKYCRMKKKIRQIKIFIPKLLEVLQDID